MKIEIRKPQDKDIDALNRLLKSQWDYHYDLDSVYYMSGPDGKDVDFARDYMDKKNVYSLIAIDEGTPVGFIVFEQGKSEHDDTAIKEFIEIYELMVDSSYRGKGLGRMLMSAAEEKSKELGYDWVKLYCSSYNDSALGFYEGLGYSDRQRLLFKKLD